MERKIINRDTNVLKLSGSNSLRYVIIIPGNPGVAEYYEHFMHLLYDHLDCEVSVLAVSHRSHCVTGHTTTIHDINDQIEHKHELLGQLDIPSDAHCVLIGHSVGCYIILQMLKESHRLQLPSGTKVNQALLLFPTVERMAESPEGQSKLPFLQPISQQIAAFLVWLFCFILPITLRLKLVKWWLGQKVPECAVRATAEHLINPKVLKNVLFMAHSELKQVRQPDINTAHEWTEKLVWLYGASDGWCPQEYFWEMKEKLPSHANLHLDDKGAEHAFVLRHNESVADFCSHWIKTKIDN